MPVVLLNPPRRRRRRRRSNRGRRRRYRRRRRNVARRGAKRKTPKRRAKRRTKRKKRSGYSAAVSRAIKPLVCAPGGAAAKKIRARYKTRFCPAPVGRGEKLSSAQSRWEALRGGGKVRAKTSKKKRRAYNPRRRRRTRSRRRNYSTWLPAYGNGTSSNPSWVPSYATNPSYFGATKAFSKKNIMAGATVIGSMYAAGLIQDALFTGVSLPVTVGGNVLIAALASAINPLVGIGVLAHVGKTLVYPMIGMSGLGDYLTRANAAEARSLGDYLTRTNAAEARSLGSYATSMMTGDPLKDFSQAGGLNRTGLTHFAQAQRLNPYNMQGMAGAIDATAAHELSTSF